MTVSIWRLKNAPSLCATSSSVTLDGSNGVTRRSLISAGTRSSTRWRSIAFIGPKSRTRSDMRMDGSGLRPRLRIDFGGLELRLVLYRPCEQTRVRIGIEETAIHAIRRHEGRGPWCDVSRFAHDALPAIPQMRPTARLAW